jgi:hypothetical protein
MRWKLVKQMVNGEPCVLYFDTEAAARKCLDGLRRAGNGNGWTLFPPKTEGIFLC